MDTKRKQAIHRTKIAQNRKSRHNEKPPDVTEKIDPDLMVGMKELSTLLID